MNGIGTILLTGGAGFIGSHTCLDLLKKGYKIIILDSFINSSPKSLDRIKEILRIDNPELSLNLELREGTLIDKRFIHSVFDEAEKKGSRIDAVMHFAGLKSVQESIIKPLFYWEENVLGTMNLLNIMKEFSCHKIVFSSSATIYKNINYELINEECEIGAINPYGNTKVVNEKLLFDLYSSNTKIWHVMNLRYFNPIGAHSSGLLGESPNGKPDNIFPLIMKSASTKEHELNVFGNNWPTKDGSCIRDYIHVMDLAEGHIKALEFLNNNPSNVYNINLGTGKGTSVLELIKIFEDTNNVKINYRISERRKGDLAVVVADNKLAKKLLQWTPSRTVERMCKDGWIWKNKNPKGFL